MEIGQQKWLESSIFRHSHVMKKYSLRPGRTAGRRDYAFDATHSVRKRSALKPAYACCFANQSILSCRFHSWKSTEMRSTVMCRHQELKTRPTNAWLSTYWSATSCNCAKWRWSAALHYKYVCQFGLVTDWGLQNASGVQQHYTKLRLFESTHADTSRSVTFRAKVTCHDC